VVVPAYNLADYLGETIDSILNQDYPNIEVIVLDDGSTDDTKRVLERYAGRIYFESHPNMGQVNTLNKAWGIAKGEILGWIGADDALAPGAIRKTVEAMTADPELVLTYGDFNLIDSDSRFIRRVRTNEFDYREMVVNVVCTPGPGAFFRRSALEATGPWDNSLRIMLDYDYWLRLGLKGKCQRIPEVLALYRIHPGQESFSKMDDRKAAEPVRVIQRLFETQPLPDDVKPYRQKALSNAYLVSAQLNFRGGRYKLGFRNLRDAFSLAPENFATLKTLRMTANVLFNRTGHKIWWKINRLLRK
jgi:glycosyltransferase involved in cell wall biosynthesis